jgi:hypothetical protein
MFARQLDDWTAYFPLTGGAAATLLGLLFVAVSLRLQIFRRADVADVRLFARFTLWTFLLTGAIAALALAPHERPEPISVILLTLSIAGLLVLAEMVRVWRRLNFGSGASALRHDRNTWRGWVFVACMGLGYAGLIVVAVLLWRQHPAALGLLASIEAWLVGLGTIGAWIMLTHAGDDAGADSARS